MTKAKKKQIAGWLLVVFIFVGLATYMMPFMRVQIGGVGLLRYSFSDLVGFLPKPDIGTSQSSKPKIHFKEALEKLVKKVNPPSKQGGGFPFSGPFILGLLIPVALAWAYVLLLVTLILEFADKKKRHLKYLLLSALCAFYAMAGSVYLSYVARKAVSDSGGKFFSLITKAFSQSIDVASDYGVHVLLIALVAGSACVLYRRAI